MSITSTVHTAVPRSCELFPACCASVQAMISAWEAGCGELDQYGMQYSRTFANLCNAGVPVQMLAEAAVQTCQTPTAAA